MAHSDIFDAGKGQLAWSIGRAIKYLPHAFAVSVIMVAIDPHCISLRSAVAVSVLVFSGIVLVNFFDNGRQVIFWQYNHPSAFLVKDSAIFRKLIRQSSDKAPLYLDCTPDSDEIRVYVGRHFVEAIAGGDAWRVTAAVVGGKKVLARYVELSGGKGCVVVGFEGYDPNYLEHRMLAQLNVAFAKG
ncbi:hypothetical protein [Sphingobium sp.]|uniref:hypothetical protein n=1 Tax=Sphingobium sp. TaxID=1912891 RepID=UPI000DB4B4FE|nr:hypothetical protein [Sphingobium sp.]PZU71041.1 MAG: hypothetical protein DI540_00880 [Sphingobium sp.]